MNHFPIQRVTFNSPQHRPPIYAVQAPQYVTFDQLRQENQTLKRQLSDLLKTQPRQNHFASTTPFYKTYSTNPDQQDVEVSFKRKMSKLKAGRSNKSNRNSMDCFNATTPSSPRKKNRNDDKAIQNISNLQFRESPFKAMVIEQDQKGNFFRNKQKEDYTMTARNTMTQPNFHQKNSYESQRYPKNGHFPIENQARKIPQRVRTHQRAESSCERETPQYGDTTQRIVPIYSEMSKLPTPGFPKQKTEGQEAKSYKTPFIPVSPRQAPANPNIKLSYKEVKQNVKPSLTSPRGNVYIEKSDSLQNFSGIKPGSEQSISGDSLLSIQTGLKQKKPVGKLRYDIYLDDEKGEL